MGVGIVRVPLQLNGDCASTIVAINRGTRSVALLIFSNLVVSSM